MEDDPVEERVAIDMQVLDRLDEVGGHEQEPRHGVGLEQRQLVLAEHALRHVAHDESRLGGQRRAGNHPERTGQRAGTLEPPLQALGHRRQQSGDAVDVDLGPLGAVDRLGLGQRLRRLDPGVDHHVRARVVYARG
jgi:hypothetical protein